MSATSADMDMMFVDGADEYDRQMDACNKKQGTEKTWKGNHLEYGRRVWKWWANQRHKFQKFDKEIWVVALIQP